MLSTKISLMAKYGLYSKNNLEECITVISKNNSKSALLYFMDLKRLSLYNFSKLFEVKEIK